MNESPVVTQHINLGYLMLMADGDRPMQKLMLSMLLDEIPAQLQQMNAAFEVEDWYLLRRLSHKMKTTLSFVGNDTLILANYELVEAIKAEQSVEKISQLLTQLNEAMPAVLEEVEAVYKQLEKEESCEL